MSKTLSTADRFEFVVATQEIPARKGRGEEEKKTVEVIPEENPLLLV